ncbi:oligoribonuclease [Pullulanibacillus sp. KACC 23026]|uniref:DHH family phosphoesterase n=1 Tax=Pullulanibacillus sp. KACC 23026 TaxID=3028315 RepID=UPI0023B164B8|nr:oligoribonuclease [Pullulanibacillus sp. KACC 23026]WEG11785.1 oligoribonuclease [Pullulanibacillus sp. KACC 23026]
MIKLITDSDLDGVSCGILAKLAFNEAAEVLYTTPRWVDQRVKETLQKIEDSTKLIITDLSVSPEVAKLVNDAVKKGQAVKLIDHHGTALFLNEFSWADVKPEDITGRKTSAASLFYEDLKTNNKLGETEALDTYIDWVRQYDTWEWDERGTYQAKQLNSLYGLIGRELFEAEMVTRLTNETVSFSFSDTEETLLRVEEKKVDRYINSKKRQVVQTTIDNYCVGVVYAEQYQSELGNLLNEAYPHLDLITMVNPGTKGLSFRTIHDAIDVSVLASKYGGGGHPKASGAELTEAAFKTFMQETFSMAPIKPDPERNEFNQKESEFGTCYANRKGDKLFIRKLGVNQWEVLYQGKKWGQTFNQFSDAERAIKREFGVWLRYDDELFYQITSSFPLTLEEVKSRYKEMMALLMQ